MRDWLMGFATRTDHWPSLPCTADVSIRRAQPRDIEALHDMLVATWHATYDGWIGAEAVAEISARWHSRERLMGETALADAVFLLATTRQGRPRAWSREAIIGTAFASRVAAPLAGVQPVAGTGSLTAARPTVASARPSSTCEPVVVDGTEAPVIVEIGRLYVARGVQGRGIGRQLLGVACAAFVDATHFRLDVDPRNRRAIAFYARHGFVVTGEGEDCGGSGLPHLVMERAQPRKPAGSVNSAG